MAAFRPLVRSDRRRAEAGCRPGVAHRRASLGLPGQRLERTDRLTNLVAQPFGRAAIDGGRLDQGLFQVALFLDKLAVGVVDVADEFLVLVQALRSASVMLSRCSSSLALIRWALSPVFRSVSVALIAR